MLLYAKPFNIRANQTTPVSPSAGRHMTDTCDSLIHWWYIIVSVYFCSFSVGAWSERVCFCRCEWVFESSSVRLGLMFQHFGQFHMRLSVWILFWWSVCRLCRCGWVRVLLKPLQIRLFKHCRRIRVWMSCGILHSWTRVRSSVNHHHSTHHTAQYVWMGLFLYIYL